MWVLLGCVLLKWFRLDGILLHQRSPAKQGRSAAKGRQKAGFDHSQTRIPLINAQENDGIRNDPLRIP
jgi:hypothetical protein